MIRAEFKLNLNKIKADIDKKVITIQKRVAMEVLGGIVNMMPVDTGRARGNWYVTLGNPTDQVAMEGFARSSQEVISRGEAVVKTITTLGAIYLTNNVPYIIPLETGHSTQAPSGFVQVTLDRVGAQFR